MMQEVSQPTAECPHPELWKMDDDNSAECEVADFIRSLVVAVKPDLVVETGTHLGRTAAKIAISLNYNYVNVAACIARKGKLITCDPNFYQQAEDRLKVFGEYVDYRHCSSLDLKVEGSIDILFCDSDPLIRLQEVEHFKNNLTPQSIILIHDVNTGCHNELRERVLKSELSVVLLPTPRGLAICQKR